MSGSHMAVVLAGLQATDPAEKDRALHALAAIAALADQAEAEKQAKVERAREKTRARVAAHRAKQPGNAGNAEFTVTSVTPDVTPSNASSGGSGVTSRASAPTRVEEPKSKSTTPTPTPGASAREATPAEPPADRRVLVLHAGNPDAPTVRPAERRAAAVALVRGWDVSLEPTWETLAEVLPPTAAGDVVMAVLRAAGEGPDDPSRFLHHLASVVRPLVGKPRLTPEQAAHVCAEWVTCAKTRDFALFRGWLRTAQQIVLAGGDPTQPPALDADDPRVRAPKPSSTRGAAVDEADEWAALRRGAEAQLARENAEKAQAQSHAQRGVA